MTDERGYREEGASEDCPARRMDASASDLREQVAPAPGCSEGLSLPARSVVATAVAFLAVSVASLGIMALLGWLS